MVSLDSSSAIDAVGKDITNLPERMKNWLQSEVFIQRGLRVQYIVNYLGQVEAILSYASHRARSALPISLAGAELPHPSSASIKC